MKIINQEAIVVPHTGTSVYKTIENIARTCYKSEPTNTTVDNSKRFVANLIRSGHGSTIEHEYVYFKLDESLATILQYKTPKCILRYINIVNNYVSGSFRAWLDIYEKFFSDTSSYSRLFPSIKDMDASVVMELVRLVSVAYPEIIKYDLSGYEIDNSLGNIYMMSRDDFIYDVITNNSEEMADYILGETLIHSIKFITNRAIANELVRHRHSTSFAQESQRYVSYSSDKYGNEITVIAPLFSQGTRDYDEWHYAMEWCETVYMNMRSRGVSPQIARGVLPNDCKTEIVVTATENEWQHIINLRYYGTTGSPHPQMRQLMELALPILKSESNNRIK